MSSLSTGNRGVSSRVVARRVPVAPTVLPGADLSMAVDTAPPGPSARQLLASIVTPTRAQAWGRMRLRPGDQRVRALYGTARLRIPLGTDLRARVGLAGHDGVLRPVSGGAPLTRPVLVKNPIHAFVAPIGIWRVGRPLLDWATRYEARGVTFAGGEPRLLGRLTILRVLHSRRLDRMAARAIANVGVPGRVPPKQPPVTLALNGLEKLTCGTSEVGLSADTVLPPRVRLPFGDNVLVLPGGPTSLRVAAHLRVLKDRQLMWRLVPADPGLPLFESAAARLQLRAEGLARVGFDARRKMRIDAAGHAQVRLERIRFEARPRETPDANGVAVVGGDIRPIRPVQPALAAPVTFALRGNALSAHGTARLRAGAMVLSGTEPVPAPDNANRILDVRGKVDFAIAQAGPGLRASGTVLLRPPESEESFAFRVCLPSEEGNGFEPLEDAPPDDAIEAAPPIPQEA